MRQIFSQLFYELEKQRSCVLVTLTDSHGSAPRKAGAQMLVGAEGRLVGSIGGGAVEGRSIALCRELLAQGRSCCCDFPLHPREEGDIGMLCGGDVSAHFQLILAGEPLWQQLAAEALSLMDAHQPGWLLLAEDGSSPALLSRDGVLCGRAEDALAASARGTQLLRLPGHISVPLPVGNRALLFGAGHIAQSLCPLLAGVDFRPVVIDPRPELATAALFPAAEQVICGDFARISDYLTTTEEDFVVVMTSGHAGDLAVQQQVLRGPFAYVGVIGSRRKTEAVNQRLRESGVDPEAIARVHTPVGTPILAVTPAEIAVSIAGEMIRERALRRGPTPHGCPMHG